MKMRRRNFKSETEPENFWPAFTDMISTIALILFFIVLLAYVQNLISGSNLEHAKKQLQDTEKKLEESRAEISQAEKNLRLLEDDLEDTKAEIKEGQIALKLSEDQIDEQKQIIAESNKELGVLRTKLEGIAVLRLDVLNKVKLSIENELGTTNDKGQELVLIGDNGNIIINESLVFETNEYEIKEEGKPLLDKLAEAFENVLNDENVRANIDTVVIEGHADERGEAVYNRELSADRARTVVDFMFSSNSNLENKYGEYFSASAYSEFRPISDGTTDADYARNRRIEISIVLKDSNIQNVINDYLSETLEFLESNGND